MERINTIQPIGLNRLGNKYFDFIALYFSANVNQNLQKVKQTLQKVKIACLFI